MTGVYTELENVYAGKRDSPLQCGSTGEPEGTGSTEGYSRPLSPLTLPPLKGTLGTLSHTNAHRCHIHGAVDGSAPGQIHALTHGSR